MNSVGTRFLASCERFGDAGAFRRSTIFLATNLTGY